VSSLRLVIRLALAGALALGWCAAVRAQPECGDLQPFTATYALEWHGLTAGYATLALTRQGANLYQYSSVNRAHGLFRLAFPDALSERSTFQVVGGHLEPLAYQEDNGHDPKNPNVALTFDWKRMRVHGTVGTKVIDAPLERGTQDALSVQIELMRDLLAGRAPPSFLLFDKDRTTRFYYTREREEQLDTPLGRLKTVIYRSDRPGYDRVMRLWLAPSLGYLPARAERRRKGNVEFELYIRKVVGLPSPDASAGSEGNVSC